MPFYAACHTGKSRLKMQLNLQYYLSIRLKKSENVTCQQTTILNAFEQQMKIKINEKLKVLFNL